METWAQIPNAPRYEVSNLGQVRNALSGKTVKISIPKSGHPRVHLFLGPKQKWFELSRLVAVAFLPRPYHPRPYVKMRDGDRLNCSADNLRWALRPKPGEKEWRYVFDDLGES